MKYAWPLAILVTGLALARVPVAAAQSAGGPAQAGRGSMPSSSTDITGGPPGSDAAGEAQSLGSEFPLRKSAMVIGQAGPVDPKTYILGPGDVLQLELWGKLTRTALFEVSPEGKVFLTGAGPLEVAGHTLTWAQERSEKVVAETFRGVHSDLRLVRLRTFRVYVAGLVNRQGAIDVTPVTRASEAVNAAGLSSGAARRGIEIRRRSGSRLRVDLDLFDLLGQQEMDPLLVDGDVLVVPRAVEFASLGGAFMNPRRFDLVSGDSLSTLFRLSGGLVPWASRERALLIRFTSGTTRESLWIDVPSIESGAVNPLMRDGDALFVFAMGGFHELPAVEINGEVVRPGMYPITLGRDHLSDLVEWAGGFRPHANRSAIFLVRAPESAAGSDVEFERLLRLSKSEMTESEFASFRTRMAERRNAFRVDFDRLKEAVPGVDPLLRPGDVVRVDPLVLSVRVDGEVKHPGLIEFAPGRTWAEYVKLAGGFTDRAFSSATRVSRSGTGQVIEARNVKSVQPGDFIWVPERRDVDAWQLFRDVVTIAAQLSVIVVAIAR